MIVVRISSEGVDMLHTIRAWGSRAFAAWIVILAFMSVSLIPSLGYVSRRPVNLLGHSEARIEAVYSPQANWLASPRVKQKKIVMKPTQAILCLAQNLYFEAANEPYEALAAVAATVFNRMNSNVYPASVCGVVYQPYQYSWTLDRDNWGKRPPSVFMTLAKEFIRSRDILTKEYPVTHFHRVDIQPVWSHTLAYVITLGQHKFYGL
jgi:spore germination cell wall hydrolase CwlJ-like protein